MKAEIRDKLMHVFGDYGFLVVGLAEASLIFQLATQSYGWLRLQCRTRGALMRALERDGKAMSGGTSRPEYVHAHPCPPEG